MKAIAVALLALPLIVAHRTGRQEKAAEALYRPTGHRLQTDSPPREKEPASQDKQLLAASPEYLPSSQGSHCFRPVALA